MGSVLFSLIAFNKYTGYKAIYMPLLLYGLMLQEIKRCWRVSSMSFRFGRPTAHGESFFVYSPWKIPAKREWQL